MKNRHSILALCAMIICTVFSNLTYSYLFDTDLLAFAQVAHPTRGIDGAGDDDEGDGDGDGDGEEDCGAGLKYECIDAATYNVEYNLAGGANKADLTFHGPLIPKANQNIHVMQTDGPQLLRQASMMYKHTDTTDTEDDENAGKVCACVRDLGCYAPETILVMADGTSKPAEEISAGEFLWNPVTKSAVQVTRIIESDEKIPLVELGYDQSILVVSQTHPVLTDKGVKKAINLMLSDAVRGADDKFHQLSILRLRPVLNDQRVINFTLSVDSGLSADHMLLADGIVAGDFGLQQEINRSDSELALKKK